MSRIAAQRAIAVGVGTVLIVLAAAWGNSRADSVQSGTDSGDYGQVGQGQLISRP